LAISKVLKDTFKANKIDRATLGNEVPHLHWHLIPRYKTESNFNKPPWPHEKIFISEAQQIILANEIYAKLIEFNSKKYKMEIVDEQRKELCLKKIRA
jgi:diadenosine tetraphosphate (Ap4A) HIT family hydrolase